MLRRSQERNAVGAAGVLVVDGCYKTGEVERGGEVTSFVSAVVAGVGIGVVEEERAEDGAAEDEVVVVWVSDSDELGFGRVGVAGGECLLAGEDGLCAEGVVDRVVVGDKHLLICGHCVGHLCSIS